MEKTLCDRLREIDEISTSFSKSRAVLTTYLGDSVAERAIPLTPQDDIVAAQRVLLDRYKGNQVLTDAIRIEDKRTVTTVHDALVQLRGRGILPRRKDPEYNDRVKQVEELVGDTNLQTSSFLALDNFMMPFLAANAMFQSIAGLMFATIDEAKTNSSYMEFTAIGLLMGFVAGILTMNANIPRSRTADAQYLDQKIRELYPLQ
ncbi:MAG: hypothetical protein Q8L34_05455 [Candidatus Woesearchaeota archaeon]|nr:hypothetical protein [Candidatus Woesearchaeota archaeon]